MIKGVKISLFLVLILGMFSFSKDFILDIPQGFPVPFIPADNQLTQSRIDLGKKLFFDTMMSRDSTVSCATSGSSKQSICEKAISREAL